MLHNEMKHYFNIFSCVWLVIRIWECNYARYNNIQKIEASRQIPFGLVVRIPGFHSGGPGSISGIGNFFMH